MGKEKESKGYIGVQKYRVECNRGSKYFKNDDKASAYFDYMTACGFDTELWLVRHFYDEHACQRRANSLGKRDRRLTPNVTRRSKKARLCFGVNFVKAAAYARTN